MTSKNPLLDELGDDIYGELVQDEGLDFPRHRVNSDRCEAVLLKVIELVLQVIPSLASRDPGYLDSRAVKSLATNLRKVSQKMDSALWDARVSAQLKALPPEPDLRGLPDSMRKAADKFDQAARVPVRLVREGNPNPQVRFALYLVEWIKRISGRPHYRLVADLLEGAFHARKKTPPPWIERLEIEMNRKKRYRRILAKRLTLA